MALPEMGLLLDSYLPNVLLSILVLAGTFYIKRKRQLSLPPGPRKLPVFGNLFQLPSSFEWETYAKWSEESKSDVIHLNVAGTSIVILNSLKAATELFDKRSAIYSSRPETVMLHELTGWGCLFGFMPYGDAWRERRKLFTQHFQPTQAEFHQPYELEYTHKMVRRLLDSPEKFMEHSRFLAGAMTISVAYGLEIERNDDPYLELAEKALITLSKSAAPGAFLVDSIPLLKYIPDWVPGAGFKRKAKEWKSLVKDMMNLPFEAAQRAIAEGTASPSFVSSCLADMDETLDVNAQRMVIRDTAGTIFVGGADTVVSAINTFILAMTCYPEIQRRAQQELDRVLPPGQLPGFEDEPLLPYIAAAVKEVIRWQSITPLAIPHYLTEDDEYNGYFIPKGTIVVGNGWAMTHDEEDYPEPFEFRPERFLKDGRLDPDVRDPGAAFGFGRRACPAKHIALSTLWITMASILTVYDISPELDDDGCPLLPKQEYISSMIVHPAPFKCCIKPRSEKTKELILSLEISSS